MAFRERQPTRRKNKHCLTTRIMNGILRLGYTGNNLFSVSNDCKPICQKPYAFQMRYSFQIITK